MNQGDRWWVRRWEAPEDEGGRSKIQMNSAAIDRYSQATMPFQEFLSILFSVSTILDNKYVEIFRTWLTKSTQVT